jgi:hypothetical protein
MACTGVAAGDKVYSWNDLMLVTSYTAKDTCSCLFVMGQTEDYCRAWTAASPAVTNWSADMNKKTVEATAIYFWGAKAHWVNDQQGCILDQ